MSMEYTPSAEGGGKTPIKKKPDFGKRMNSEELEALRNQAFREMGLEIQTSKTETAPKAAPKSETAQDISIALREKYSGNISTLDQRKMSVESRLKNPGSRTEIQGVKIESDDSLKKQLEEIAEQRKVDRMKYEWMEHTVVGSPKEMRKALDVQQEKMAASYREALSRGIQEQGSPGAAQANDRRLAPLKLAMKAYDELDRDFRSKGF